MDFRHLKKLAKAFKTAALTRKAGEEVTAKILSVEERDGVIKYYIQFDEKFDNKQYPIHFLIDEDDDGDD